MKKRISEIECAIFDLDGTLIDSVPVYFKTMTMILETLGLPPAPREVVAEFMTGGGLKAIEKAIPKDRRHEKDELIQQFTVVGRRISRESFKDQVKLFEGVPNLFNKLQKLKIPIGIVTSTEKMYIDRKMKPLDKRGLRGHVGAIVVIEDAPRKKPAPDPLLACSKKLKVPPENCLYMGDSHIDIQAANAAGMFSIGVLTGLDDRETLTAQNPDLILNVITDLEAMLS